MLHIQVTFLLQCAGYDYELYEYDIYLIRAKPVLLLKNFFDEKTSQTKTKNTFHRCKMQNINFYCIAGWINKGRSTRGG